jgi:hypothetical protein
MVPDKKRHAGSFGRFHELGRGRNLIGNGLLDQGRDAGGDTFQTIGDVDLVRSRNDDAVRFVRLDEGGKARSPPDPHFLRHDLSGG